jgi:2-pyrone-4,6-dicarboxylate lactonase
MKHLGAAAGSAMDDIIALTHRLAPLGMHLQVHFESALVHELTPHLQRSAVPVVIDHMGRVDARLGPNHADFVQLCRLMEDPRFHVKVSGADRVDAVPPYVQGMALARHLVSHFGDRCFWGTDWPHPNHTHVPDDGTLVDLLPQIAPTPALMQALLVDNPARFYRFED